MRKNIKPLIEIFFIGITVFVISNFFFQICFVRGNSMVPTLKNGQLLIAQKFNIKVTNNDIVVIKKNNKIIIKRVIGIPNDKIIVLDGYVYVNNNKSDDRYIKNPGMLSQEIQLKNDQYFVLGDNRNESIDSRFDEIGLIEKNEIIGKIN